MFVRRADLIEDVPHNRESLERKEPFVDRVAASTKIKVDPHFRVSHFSLHPQYINQSIMAGPNLEVFKFGLYLFFPLAVMIHYGDPDWYKKNVLPLRDEFWPKEETLFVSRSAESWTSRHSIEGSLKDSTHSCLVCHHTETTS